MVTGRTTGIGRAIAFRLIQAGAYVLIYGRHETELRDALEYLKLAGNGKVFGLTADQSRFEDIQRVFREVEETMLKAEEIAEAVYYILTQPQRCDVIQVRIRSHGQAI